MSLHVAVGHLVNGAAARIGTVFVGEAVSFGNERTQIVVPTDEWLPPVCVTLVVTAQECVLADVSEVEGLCDLNGQLFQRANLQTGDILRIGPARFTFEIYGEASSVPVSLGVTEPTPADDDDVAHGQLWARTVRESVHSLEPLEPGISLSTVVRAMCEWSSPILLANYRAAGLALPGGVSPEEDHYSEAPTEVRAVHSLHTLRGPVNDLLVHYGPLHDLDGAIWAFCRPDSDDASLEQAKLYLAWFARPSLLERTLEQASRELCSSILEPFEALCLQPREGFDWVIYSNEPLDPSRLGVVSEPAGA